MVRFRPPAPGRFPERPKGADCKSVVTDFGGPNPPSPTTKKTSIWMSFFVGGGWSSDYFLALLGKDVVRSFALRPSQLASEGREQKPRNARIHP